MNNAVEVKEYMNPEIALERFPNQLAPFRDMIEKARVENRRLSIHWKPGPKDGDEAEVVGMRLENDGGCGCGHAYEVHKENSDGHAPCTKCNCSSYHSQASMKNAITSSARDAQGEERGLALFGGSRFKTDQ